MSANVGLSTPRGSGTSGYVQRNLSNLRPRDRERGAPYSKDEYQKHKQRKPDKEILEHERKRRVEVKVFELRDKLEEEGVDEDEIDERVDALRKNLLKESEKGSDTNVARGLKAHQVHDLAKAKIEETERVRKAFGIREDYVEGSHWKRQEERKREAEVLKEQERIKEEEREKEQERGRERHSERDRSNNKESSRERSEDSHEDQRRQYSDSEEEESGRSD